MSWSLVNQYPGAGNPGNAKYTTADPTVGGFLGDPISISQTAGNLLIITVMVYAATTVNSITDTAGNTWHLAKRVGGTDFFNCEIWYAYNCVGQTADQNVITVHLSAVDYVELCLAQFNNGSAITSDPFDKSAAAHHASGENPDSGNTPTTTVADELLIGAISHCAFFNTLTWDSGWIDITHPDDWSHFAYQVVSSTGAYKASGVYGSAMQSGTVIATFGVAGTPPAPSTNWFLLQMKNQLAYPLNN